jgi:hypothetical protein
MRTYSAAERTAGVALAASIGPKKAALQLDIPVTTLVYWMHRPAASPIIAAAEASIAERLEAAHKIALDAVLAGLAEPRAKLGDRAQALRVLGEQANLAMGRATMRSENVNLNLNQYEMTLDAMNPAAYHAMLAAMAEYTGENVVDHLIEALRRLSPEQTAELEARIVEAEKPITWDETPSEGIYGELVEFPGSLMYYTADDPRWQTGALVRRFDPRRGPSGRLTDGQ